MKKIMHRTKLGENEAGQGFVEYAIILILVGIAVVLVVSLMQPAIGDVFSRFVAQAPVAPPSLLDYTPPPTSTDAPTTDPNATNTSAPPANTNTPVPPTATDTSPAPTATNTTVPPADTNTPTAVPCSYGPHTVPGSGTLRVQMEDFRCGGAGVGFSDNGGDGGPGSGAYRDDTGSEGPDLQTTSDTGGGYNLGWTRDNEWIEYEIIAPATAAYTFIIRHSTPGGNNPQLQIRTTQGGFEANTATLNMGTTGGWQNWQNYSIPVTLFSGTNIVRFTIVNGPGNYNYFEIQPYVPTATPTPVTPTATPVPSNTPAPTNTPAPITLTLSSNSDHDGDIREQAASNTGGTTNNGRTEIYVGDDNTGNNRQYVGIISFDTSAIPTNATITSVQVRLLQQNIVGDPFGDLGLGILYADIGTFNGFNGSNDLESEDFEAPAAATNVLSFSEPSGNNVWTSGALGTANYGFINRTGFTQFRIHFQSTDDGDGSNDQFRFYSGNSGSANRPQLIITYTVP